MCCTTSMRFQRFSGWHRCFFLIWIYISYIPFGMKSNINLIMCLRHVFSSSSSSLLNGVQKKTLIMSKLSNKSCQDISPKNENSTFTDIRIYHKVVWYLKWIILITILFFLILSPIKWIVNQPGGHILSSLMCVLLLCCVCCSCNFVSEIFRNITLQAQVDGIN